MVLFFIKKEEKKFKKNLKKFGKSLKKFKSIKSLKKFKNTDLKIIFSLYKTKHA